MSQQTTQQTPHVPYLGAFEHCLAEMFLTYQSQSAHASAVCKQIAQIRSYPLLGSLLEGLEEHFCDAAEVYAELASQVWELLVLVATLRPSDPRDAYLLLAITGSAGSASGGGGQ